MISKTEKKPKQQKLIKINKTDLSEEFHKFIANNLKIILEQKKILPETSCLSNNKTTINIFNKFLKIYFY